MIIHRKREYFTYDEPSAYVSTANTPPCLFRQERDWTCSIACIRTILSGITDNIPDEEDFLKKYNLIPGPHFVAEFLEKNVFAQATNIVTHLSFPQQERNLQLLNRLLRENYYIMAECLFNYDHWMVILGYFATRDKEDTEEHSILVYDPYFDKVRLLIAEEFETMWCSPEGNYREFAAIK